MIKKIKLFYLIIFLLNLLFVGVLTTQTVSAQSTESISFTPQISIPGSMFTKGNAIPFASANTGYIAKYIKAIYNYALSIVGILATIVLMIGGYLWAMSAGDASKITQAKEMITGAIVGMLILLSSVTLLNKINPDLTSFRPREIEKIETVVMGCCVHEDSVAVYTTNKDKKCGNTFIERGIPNLEADACETTGCCLAKISGLKTNCFNTSEKFCTDNGLIEFTPDTYCEDSDKNYCYPSGYYNYGPLSCQEKHDGDECKGNSNNCYCYKNLPWIGDGAKGEPCGKWVNASCQDGTWGCPGDLIHDSGGGRDCGHGLYCCYVDNQNK